MASASPDIFALGLFIIFYLDVLPLAARLPLNYAEYTQMKLFFAIILAAILVFLGTQVYKFSVRESEAQKEFSDLRAQLAAAKADQSKLQAELDYYLNPANLEKELRARFNYKQVGENLIILVPGSSSPATGTAR